MRRPGSGPASSRCSRSTRGPISNIAGASRWPRPPEMGRRRGNPWFGIGFDAWTLGLEASAVIGLRAMKIAQGGAASQAEAERMVSEKVQAALDLQLSALTGGLRLTSPTIAAK